MSQTTSAMTQITCPFCRGTGKDPFELLSELTACQVCNGTGKVEEPAIKENFRNREKKIKADLEGARKIWEKLGERFPWWQSLP